MLYARDIMTTEVLTVSPETSIADLSKTLENRQIGGVPVVDQGGRLVGIVTQSDLVERARDLELPPAINILDFHFYLQIPSHSLHKVEKMLGTTVGDCMSLGPRHRGPGHPGPPDRRRSWPNRRSTPSRWCKGAKSWASSARWTWSGPWSRNPKSEAGWRHRRSRESLPW